MCIVKYIQINNLVFKCVICSSVCMVIDLHHTIPLVRASHHLLIFQTQLRSIQAKRVHCPKPLPSLGHHVAEASSHNFCTAAAEFLGTSPSWIADDPKEFPGHPFHGELVQLLCLKLYSSAETSSKFCKDLAATWLCCSQQRLCTSIHWLVTTAPPQPSSAYFIMWKSTHLRKHLPG